MRKVRVLITGEAGFIGSHLADAFLYNGDAIVPDCGEPDSRHDPPGRRPAAYTYIYADPLTGLSGLCRALCVECCARYRLASEQPGADSLATPRVTHIRVLLDANTLKPVL